MKVQCQILSETEKQLIHEQSLRILSEVGVALHSQKARAILKKHGAQIDELNAIVTIPEELVRQALNTAPRSFTLGARLPEKDFHLPSSRSGYVLDNGGIYIRDFKSGERRISNSQDNKELLRVFDEMKFAAVVWPTTVHELDRRYSTVITAITSFIHSTLHIQDELEQPHQVPIIIEALEAILGSAQAVKERKIYSVIYCTLPPLGHEGSMCDAYLELLDYEVPICIFPMPSAGSTGPASLFSNIAMANAEALSALTLFQFAKPGTPIIMGDGPGSTDFHTGDFLEGSAEMVLQSAALGEMARFYNLPNEQAGCLTDAKEHGPQAIMEKMLTTLPLVLNGVDLIQGPGALDASNTMSLEQIVVDDEIALLCQRLRDGVDVSKERDYFDDIKNVGPGGHFLGQRNTRIAARSDEFVTPALADRNSFNQWVELGRPDLYDNARVKVEEILSSPQKNPLPDAVIGKLEDIIQKINQKN